jgi:hypothetical protein
MAQRLKQLRQVMAQTLFLVLLLPLVAAAVVLIALKLMVFPVALVVELAQPAHLAQVGLELPVKVMLAGLAVQLLPAMAQVVVVEPVLRVALARPLLGVMAGLDFAQQLQVKELFTLAEVVVVCKITRPAGLVAAVVEPTVTATTA